MKKFISLIGALALGGTSSLTVVACGNNGGNKPTPKPSPHPGTANIKQWSMQTSQIAKALILSKDENYNTNRLVSNALNSETNNIVNNSQSTSVGDSYENFKNAWGYQGEIEGITAQDFNSNSAKTTDNAQLNEANQINSTISQVQQYLKYISPTLFKNGTLYGILNLAKSELVPALWSLHQNPSIINTIQDVLPSVGAVFTNLGAFDAKTELGKYYVDNDPASSVLGKNEDGWVYNYKSNGFTSDAVTQKSDVLKAQNFKNWDQVALFKTSIDLNGLIYNLSGDDKASFGTILNDNITYDKDGKATEFNLMGALLQLASYLGDATPANIVNLVADLIPIIKYEMLGFLPTQAVKVITTSQATDVKQGILNIKDVLDAVQKILTTQDGFVDFFSKLLVNQVPGKFNLENYGSFDFTCTGKKTISETLAPIKDQVIESLQTAYQLLASQLSSMYLSDIFAKIKTDLETLTTNFEFQVSDFADIVNILSETKDFFDTLLSYKSQDDLSNNWIALWGKLGLQAPDQKNFIAGSVFDKIQKFLAASPKFMDNVSNLLTVATKIISDSTNVLIDKETTANLDFHNQTLWNIPDASVSFLYDSTTNTTTISYTLIDKVKKDNPVTYKVSVVVQGNADQPLGKDQHQIWLKSLKQES